jgi:APA family basic amino acid/polyamine antiporter
VIALLPFLVMLGGFYEFDLANYGTTLNPRETLAGATFGITAATAVAAEPQFVPISTPARFALIMLPVMWAYNGWHGITPVAEEIREPQRNIPLALFGGIAILIVLYVGANLAYHGVLTMGEIGRSGENTAQQMVAKLFSSGSRGLAGAGVAAISAVIMCSTFGAINSNLLDAPRISFAMGRDDVFFRQLGQVHVNYRTPAVAIVVQGVMSAVLLVATGLIVRNLQQTSVFDMLTNFVIFSASIFYMLSVLAVILLRWRHPDWERPYRTWGYPVVPIAYLLFYVWFLWKVYEDQPFESNAGLGLIALGVPVYFAWRAWAARHPQNLSDGV